jgi:hypothetical protein
MPAKKKLKSKTKPKRKKTRITKATTGRKTATVTRKPTKKPARRAVSKKGKPTAVIKAAPRVPAQTAPSEERIGIVTHYFNHLSVATLRLESGRLRVGDTIHFRGHTTDLTQRVESLEVNHAAVMEVGPNDDFGFRVIGHVREHDVVYKVRSQRPRE